MSKQNSPHPTFTRARQTVNGRQPCLCGSGSYCHRHLCYDVSCEATEPPAVTARRVRTNNCGGCGGGRRVLRVEHLSI